MLQEECKEKILSEEYRDFMMRDTGALGKNFPLENGCRIPLKYGFELFILTRVKTEKSHLPIILIQWFRSVIQHWIWQQSSRRELLRFRIYLVWN